MNRVFRGVRVQRMRIKCLVGGVSDEVRNSSINLEAMAKPKPLESCQQSDSGILELIINNEHAIGMVSPVCACY